MNQAEKETVVEEVRATLSTSQLAVVAYYRGLTVADLTDLRRKCRKAGASYRVVKNTLAKRAIQGSSFAPLATFLEGPTAITLAADPVASSKVLTEFAKSRPALELKGAVLNGKVIGIADLVALAQMPPKEVLVGRLLGAMMRPIQDIVGVLAAVPAGLVRVLDQIRQQKAESAE